MGKSLSAKEQQVQTTCAYCGVGCGITTKTNEQGIVDLSGDESHPANRGRLCVKGASLDETVELSERLLTPEVKGEKVSWDSALETVATEFNRLIKTHGSDAVAFYVSGQLLTEDYYVANKLMKGFIGSANIDTNSRLCMSSAVAAQKRAYGTDTVPGCYEDLEQAEVIVITGSNTAWAHPIVYQRIVAAKEQNPELKVVVIDPRKTATCEIADIHLALKPGSDGFLFSGLLTFLADNELLDNRFIEEHTTGFDDALLRAREQAEDSESVAHYCQLPIEQVEIFYRWFAAHQRVVTLFSQGINQSSSGTDKGNLIINCHLATGKIGKPGAAPFSITGQPNAMGGREVGGLANQLAAHMELGNPHHRDRVARFWQAPVMPEKEGLKAVDLFDALDKGTVKAVWIMATNPLVSLPDAEFMRRALAKAELVVISDSQQQTDTSLLADVKLPAMTWAEKEGTVTNSERCISRQRRLVTAPAMAKPDWWIVCEVAKKMGYADAFDYQGPADIFREHAALSAFENNEEFDAGLRDFNLSGLRHISDTEYDDLLPIQWPVVKPFQGTQRLFDDGQFYTDDRKARFIAVKPRLPAQQVSTDFPLLLNTGRVRDQWHTMTRTARSAKLMAHRDEPFAELHPDDIEALALNEGQLVTVTSSQGSVVVRLLADSGQQRGSVFMPIHWNDQQASKATVGSLVANHVDPVSGQPEFKQTPVRIEPFAIGWHGFLLSRKPVQLSGTEYWSKIKADGYYRYMIAGTDKPENWHDWVISHTKQWYVGDLSHQHMIRFKDPRHQIYRDALIIDNKIQSALFITGADEKYSLPDHQWIGSLFSQDGITQDERRCLLSGVSPGERIDAGKTVCACFNVGYNTIVEAITKQGMGSVEALGDQLKCGTNCGSCIPELKQIVNQQLS